MTEDRIPNLEDALPFADNPDQRTACCLVLDTSGSMGQDFLQTGAIPIDALNKGVLKFKEAVENDEMALRRVEVAVVTFGGKVEVAQDFVSADQFDPKPLQATGQTPLGEAIMSALDLVEKRKDTYKEHGVPYTRPWILLITDGAPTDSWKKAAAALHAASRAKKVTFFGVGVQGADMVTLAEIAPSERPPVALQGLKFSELFEWLSVSLSQVSQSSSGQQLALPSPTGWATVDV